MVRSNLRSLSVALCAFAALAAGASSSALAAPLPAIVVGTHNLAQNQANQIVDIFVTGGQSVQGLNFAVQIFDGGSPSYGNSVNAPKIISVDILTNTIFAGNNNGASLFSTTNKEYWVATTTVFSGDVAADGRLARLIIDTQGFFANGSPNTFALTLSGLEDPTDFLTMGADITNGFINIVPEPSSILMLLVGGFGVCAYAYRKRTNLRVNRAD